MWDRSAAKVFTFPGPAEWHPDAWVGRQACERIAALDADQPQLAWISLNGPQFPFDPPAEYLDRVDLAAMGEPRVAGELDDPARIPYRSLHGSDQSPGGWIESGRNDRFDADCWHRLRHHYFANVALIDDQIGVIMAAVRDKFGDGAAIVFTPDHGEMLGQQRMWGKGHCFYEDVLRVPLLLHQPGSVDAGTRSDDLASLVDLYPTFVEAAGGTTDVDGRSLITQRGHDHVFSEGERMSVVTDGVRKLVRIDDGDRTLDRDVRSQHRPRRDHLRGRQPVLRRRRARPRRRPGHRPAHRRPPPDRRSIPTVVEAADPYGG